MKLTRRKRWHWLRLTICLVVASGFVVLVWRACSRDFEAIAADEEARQFVCMHGSVGNGYRSNVLASVAAGLLPASFNSSFGATPLVTVSIPVDRMTDSMASEMVHIRDLNRVVLYPPDPGQQGIDFEAPKLATYSTLADLDMPLSEVSISKIDERFPNLIFEVHGYKGMSGVTEGSK